MLPLASILNARGHTVAGSDRAYDQRRTLDKFAALKELGIAIFPQDGSGVKSSAQTLVASAAVEDTVPDVAAALKLGARRVTRAELLAELFNHAACGIGVAGTSGKSTTTAMIAWILTHAGVDPTVMNGAVMKNFVSPDMPFASARIGEGPAFVSEIDESDGSIALFTPKVAVVNNIAHDHKTMDELRALFATFVDKAGVAVLNLDNEETAALAARFKSRTQTYSLDGPANLTARDIAPARFGVSFTPVIDGQTPLPRVDLKTPGRHNVSNALAAMLASHQAGVSLDAAATAISTFSGIARRFDLVGEARGVTVIDDFGHNPDKIAATLRTLHEFDGRLLVLFQPHGFGPLRKLKQEFIACFSDHLADGDMLYMPEPVYYGGTVTRTVSSADIVSELRDQGKSAIACETRDDCARSLLGEARPGDRIIVMGARDDTLTEFAASLVKALAAE